MARTSRRARRNSPLHLPGAFELFTPSRDLFIKNIWVFGPLYAFLFILWIHGWIYGPTPGGHLHHWWNGGWRFTGGSPGNPIPTFGTAVIINFSLIWLLIVGLMGTLVQVMTQSAQLDAVEMRRLDFGIIWKQTRPVFWRMLGLYICLAIVIGVGLCFFIVPGLILMRLFMMSPFVLLEKKGGVWEAMSESARLSRLSPGSVYGIIGVLFLFFVFNVLPIVGGLVSFGLSALYSLAPVLRYRQLKRLGA